MCQWQNWSLNYASMAWKILRNPILEFPKTSCAELSKYYIWFIYLIVFSVLKIVILSCEKSHFLILYIYILRNCSENTGFPFSLKFIFFSRTLILKDFSIYFLTIDGLQAGNAVLVIFTPNILLYFGFDLIH